MPMTQGWEIAVVGIGLGLILIALAALAGVGVSAALFGGGWVWPHGTDAIAHTIGGLAAGHPARGLAPVQAHRLAGPAATYACVVACEVIVIASAVVAGIAIAQRMRDDGMATRRDTEQILGLGELRAARTIIRPDLYGPTEKVSTRRRLTGSRWKDTS